MKQCTKCHETKPLDEFYNKKISEDGKQPECKECRKKYDSKRYQSHDEDIKKCHKEYYHHHGGREKGGHKSMYEDKTSAQYLGIVAAERLIKHLFNDIVMMPYGFPDYDMICNRGKKIDVKASTIHIQKNKNSIVNNWAFNIRYNKNCDFFLCMAFDNIEDLNPLHMWMIPGSEINKRSRVGISSTNIHKWDKWKMNISNAQSCCNIMKGD